MSSKSYSEQWRKNRKKKRKRTQGEKTNRDHDAEKEDEMEQESSPMQSQDLLEDNNNDEHMIQHDKEEIPPELQRQVQDDKEEATTKVQQEEQEPAHDQDELSVTTTNQSATTNGEERLRVLLSQALLDLTASQEHSENLQKALAASQSQCQQLQQTLSQTQQQCQVYHNKYSALKQKFYRWYNHCLMQWATKFQQGETRDVPPHPDVVGVSPQSSRQPPPRNLQDQPMHSVLHPRRILQDTDDGNSVTPSPLRTEVANDSDLLPKRLSNDLQSGTQGKENVQNQKSIPIDTSRNDLEAQNEASRRDDEASLHSQASETQLQPSLGREGQSIQPATKHPPQQEESPSATDETKTIACQDEETQLELGVASHHRINESSPSTAKSKSTRNASSAQPAATQSDPQSPVSRTNNADSTFKALESSSKKRQHDTATEVKRRPQKQESRLASEHESQFESQPLFSQLPPTPERKQFKSPAPRRKPKLSAAQHQVKSKNASVVRATEGWISNVTARTFVRNTKNPPDTSKSHEESSSLTNSLLTSTSRPLANLPPKTDQSRPNPPENPYIKSNKKPRSDSDSLKPATPVKRGTGLEWSDDDDDEEGSPKYKYNEVVRCRHHRQQMPGHCCPECDNFFDALGGDVFDRNEFMDMSRHRAQHSPDNTPAGFWELSFADEMVAREQDDDSQF